MALEANFTSVISADLKTLSIVDSSTVDYDSEVIIGRTIEITTFEKGTETFDFPIVLGIGDVFEYPIEKDTAMIVDFTLSPVTPIEESSYEEVRNLLLPHRLLNCLQEKRKDQLHSCSELCDSRAFDELEVVDSFYDAAKKLVGVDIKGTQEALDKGNKLCTAKSCKVCQR